MRRYRLTTSSQIYNTSIFHINDNPQKCDKQVDINSSNMMQPIYQKNKQTNNHNRSIEKKKKGL